MIDGQGGSTPAHRFEKVLWRRQHPFADNHVGDFFLSSLGRGAHGQGLSHPGVRPSPTLPSLLVSSTPMTQQLLLILIFVSLFSHLLLGLVSPVTLLVLSSSLSLLACLVLGALHWFLPPAAPTIRSKGKGKEEHPTPPILSLALLITVLLALSPVLRTLTSATTSDSIWALAAGLFALSFALADHSLPASEGGPSEAQETKASPTKSSQSSSPPSPISAPSSASSSTSLLPTLSLNASICASVVLASRLSSDLAVFSLLLTSIHLFALLPWLRRRVLLALASSRSRSSLPFSAALQATLTLLLLSVTALLLSPLSTPALGAALLATAFLNLAAPLWLWTTLRDARRKGWKVERGGDWDVATPRVGSRETRGEGG